MKRIGVIANIEKPDAAKVLCQLTEQAARHGLDLLVCDHTAEELPGATVVDPEQLGTSIDALLALGGDGTMLHAVRVLDGSNIPVLGVNLGSLGFMTSVTENALDQAVAALASGEYTVSIRSRLDGQVLREKKEVARFAALNDLVIGWGHSSRALTLGVSIDGDEVAQYLCDGLICSTPTGSTGHSLSAGGPIVHPESPVFCLNVICPHTLSARPLVLPNRSEVRVVVQDAPPDKQPLLSADGQGEFVLTIGDILIVRRHAADARFILLPDHSYFSVLRHKLHWRGSAR